MTTSTNRQFERYSMATPTLTHKECYKELNGATACTSHPSFCSVHPELQAEVDGLRLAIKHIAERNKELNNDLERVWDYYHNHYDECPASRDYIGAKICRFSFRPT